ncbi:zinc-binding dehydrogenase [Bifidobacterium tsurumiense]|uniref:Zinc-binding dehydrogenase n=2 Tax=Bifidobacterium tsurumiense TaxID=356829 RepID=A0A087ECB9_9BIFI|nr:zinc-binding dehydrogenase [Bifidobacterium tsurumiense]
MIFQRFVILYKEDLQNKLQKSIFKLVNPDDMKTHNDERLFNDERDIMKALVLTGVKQFEIQDLETPEIKDDEVLINTAYAGVCGTDHDLYAGRPGSAAAVPPIVLGHENSGIVAAIGSNVTNVAVGDRVAVDPNIYCGQCEYCLTQRPELCEHLSAVGVTRDGGLEEQFTAPASVVYKLPDNVSLRDAAAIEPVSCAVHGLDLLNLRPYQKALVIGDGFMGQIFAQLLQAYGVHQVDLAGIFDDKLQRNKELFGVTETYNTTKESIPSNAYDVIIEAVGLPQTQAQAIEAAKKGAQVLMFGVGPQDAHFEMNTYDIYKKQLTIQGSFINPLTFRDAISLVSSGKMNIGGLISHELELEQVQDFLDGKISGVSKAVVKVGA